ncbi:MAG TPA: dephospho-CoA kinase, partial [Chitinophagaceae bacterium]|nr:dephospho-CoA kinase [Chitinophagaceae bacterium]
MLRIGLTGGIGSGKSTVARVFEVLGVPVYYADDAAKRLMNEDGELKQKIRKEFGEAVYSDEALNRKALAEIVFNNPEKLVRL